uniref:Ionotropic receptor 75p1 n=1 Tax=Conogethes pinicolalis TaxID=1178461 RepID=A0A5B9GB98_9NEOP|nr:ionotropic receptor 75p1 [Conogethes pinicolalis]
MKLESFILFVLFNFLRVSARDDVAVNFIKQFIANEGKPTMLIFNDLCWNINAKVKLANDLSRAGHRFSTSIDLNSDYLYHNLLFLADLNCPNIGSILENAISRKLFGSPFRWLVLMDHSNGDQKGLSKLLECPLLPDNELVLAEREKNGFNMSELHRPSTNHAMIFTPRGYFNGTFVDIRPHRELYRRRKDLMGHALVMANVIQDSNSTQYHLPREDRLQLQYDSITKICWMDVLLVFQMLNVTPQYIFSHRWGYKNNGHWSGMISDVATGRADIGTNCLLEKDRMDVVHYTDTLAPFHVRFVFRQPPLSYSANIFSLPFSSSVWVAIVVCSAVATATLFLASVWEAKLGVSSSQLDGSIGDALLVTMSAVGQQGCFLEPRKLSGRIITWVIFAALMLLYAAYSANIVVLLQAPSNSIRTLAQLAASKITLAAYDVDYNHFVFKRYTDPVRVTIHKRIDPEKGKSHFYDLNEGVERIRKGLFAFHTIVEPVYRRIEETFLETEKCDLAEVDLMNRFLPFVPVTKGSPYVEMFKVAFKQIREAGFVSALVKRLQVPKPRCAHRVSSFSSVGLPDLRPVLAFMLIGTALSVGIALMEVVAFKLCNRRRIHFNPAIFNKN